MHRRLRPSFVTAAALCALAVGCSSPGSSGGPGQHGSTTTSPPPGSGPTTPAADPPFSPTAVQVQELPWRLPEAVGREAAVRIGQVVTVAGGLIAGDQSTATSFRLDLSSGHISDLPDLSVPVHDVGGVVIGGQPVVIGGGNAVEQRVVQGFGSDGAWHLLGNLPAARSDLVAVQAGHRAFVVGGYDGTSIALGDVLATTNGSHFTVFSRLDLPVRYAAVAVNGGFIWVLGGERSGAEVDAVQRINLRTGIAQVVGQLPVALGHASLVSMGDRMLLVGGRTTGSSLTAAMWWFDPATERFTKAGSLPTPLSDSAVVTDARHAYLVGGETPNVSDRVLRLTFTTGG